MGTALFSGDTARLGVLVKESLFRFSSSLSRHIKSGFA